MIIPLMIGTSELLLIGGIALLLFGGKKLPELMRGLGKGVREFKEGLNEVVEQKEEDEKEEGIMNDEKNKNDDFGLLSFCKIPRTRKDIARHLGLSSVTYAIKTYVQPLIDAGAIKLTIPDMPSSINQKYYVD